MGVNISTAKAILKVYQEEGRVGKKKKRDKVINVFKKLLTLSSKRKRNPFKLLTQEISKNSLSKNPENEHNNS